MRYFAGIAGSIICAICIAGNSFGDDIKGRIEEIDAKSAIVTVGGIKIATQNGRVENEIGQLIFVKDLAVGDFIAADGYFGNPGEFDSYKLSRDYPGHDELTARIKSIDQENNKISIRGVLVSYGKDLKIEDEDGIPTNLERLPNGSYVECRGKWTGPLQFFVNKIRRE